MLENLAARIAIEQALAEHARGIDRADEALLRGAYHDDGTVDYGAFQGSAAEFAAFLTPVQAGAPVSLHRPSNVLCRIRGDRAVSESYVIACVVMPTDGEPLPHLVGGRYLDSHSRRDGRWRMQHRQYVLDWCVQRSAPAAPGTAPPFSLTGLWPTGGHYTTDPGNALLIAHAARGPQSPRKETAAMAEDHALLDRLASHQAIVELGCKYSRGVDRGDEATIMEAFHDDAAIVAGVFNGPAAEFASTIVQSVNEAGTTLAHTVSNHWIEIDGDHAVGESYVLAYQGVPGEPPQDVITGGRYIDRYERRNGHWKIAHRTFVMDYAMADDGKDLLDSGMFGQMVKGRRGREDPVFALWASL